MTQKNNAKRLFVLDTNVLMHDPTALFNFKEHDIFLPMMVLEELDRAKKGMSEVARNARQTSRFLDELISTTKNISSIDRGVPLRTITLNGTIADSAVGKVFFQTRDLPNLVPDLLPGNIPDNNILSTALALQSEHPTMKVILVSKDINLRIKAKVIGVHAEDYSNDKVLDDVNLLYRGELELPGDFWEKHSKKIDSWQEDGHTYYRVEGPDIAEWHVGQCLYIEGEQGFESIVRECEENSAIIELATDYSSDKHAVWGISARNREQNFALNLLMDPNIDFVSLMGIAGTGKTLLTLAAGLAQVLDQNLYSEIIMTRATVPVGEDIGFLPGTEEEKMTPWMGALTDNLEVLTQAEGGEWGRAATDDLLKSRVRIHSLNFMRGRTFLKKFLILDEAQNLTAKQMKTLVTRAGPGTKVVCLGNIGQIDTPYITETSSGLTYAVDRFKHWQHSGHITLLTGERSRLADFASDNL